VCTPKCFSADTTSQDNYCHSHADKLVHEVPKVVFVHHLHQFLNLSCVIFEAGFSLVYLLDDVSDLPPGFPYFTYLVRCSYCSFSRFRFLACFFSCFLLSDASCLF